MIKYCLHRINLYDVIPYTPDLHTHVFYSSNYNAKGKYKKKIHINIIMGKVIQYFWCNYFLRPWSWCKN